MIGQEVRTLTPQEQALHDQALVLYRAYADETATLLPFVCVSGPERRAWLAVAAAAQRMHSASIADEVDEQDWS